MQVSPLCLGAMMFGAWGEPDHDTSVGIIHRALDAGINFIDTADVYSQGESEVIVGKALAGGRRDDVVLATKFHGPMDVTMGQPGGDPNKRGNSRRWIVKEVENSLRRLQTDWIDLYQVHRPEPGTDVEETLAALTDLQRQGKIRAFGSSTFPAHEVVEAQWTAQRRGRPVRHRAADGTSGTTRVPTLWIVLGPLGQGITAAGLLGANAALAVDPEMAGGMSVFAVLFGVPVWGFAVLWIALATQLTVRTLRRGMPFALTWWSLTFPVGTFVTGTTQLANHTGLPAFRVAAVIAYVGLLCTWGLVTVQTARGSFGGSLFAPPPTAGPIKAVKDPPK